MGKFKDFERQSWETKANRYHDTWGRVTAQAMEAVLQTAGLSAGKALLDCGCGPGHLCHAASQRGAKPLGCDYSTAMIEIAEQNYPELTFCVEDAENLSFAAESFDAVTLNYLLLHLEDQEKALLEAARVLRPGGRIVFTTWLPPTSSPGLTLMFSAIKEFADTSVIPPGPDIFLFADRAYAEKFLKDSGFDEISTKVLDTFWHVSDGNSFFSAVQAGSRMGGMIDLQEPPVKKLIEDKILRDIEGYANQGGFTVPTPSLLISAQKS